MKCHRDYSQLRVAVDASRSRSGGARSHLIGLLNATNPVEHGIDEIHVWSYEELLNELPERPWLIKHKSMWIEGSLLFQLVWQRWLFGYSVKKFKCDIVLNTDGGTLSHVEPSITMSRDMLSYEPGEIGRYGISISALRLYILRFVQNAAFRRSTAVIFLTKYAARVIQGSSGVVENYSIIPHGVSEEFRESAGKIKLREYKNLKLVYVSNLDLYKHQWNVVRAVGYLRAAGFDLCLTLVGGGNGQSQRLLEKSFSEFENIDNFVEFLPFVPHEAIPALLRESDIFVFASSCENLPNSLIEAMAAGLPIACSERGPMPEVLKDGGIYFNPESVESIIAAIRKLVADRKLLQYMSLRALELSGAYSWERCAFETWVYVVGVFKNYTKRSKKR